jgi:hypothetical protein
MEKKKEIIAKYNDLLFDVYQEHELKCLSDDDFNSKGRNVLGASGVAVVAMVEAGLHDHLNEVTDVLRKPRFHHMHAESELIGVSGDIKHRLGTLYLYFPYLVKLHQSHYPFGGERQFYHEPTRFDMRFNREVPIAFEALYKFWQRLMDYLLSFFPEELKAKEGRTFFHTPIDYLKKHQPQLTSSENFKWIANFAEKSYPLLNARRKRFVHGDSYDSQFFRDFLASDTTSVDAMLELEKGRDDLLPFLKEHMNLCLEGYFKVMDFLNELVINKDEDTGKFNYSLKGDV